MRIPIALATALWATSCLVGPAPAATPQGETPAPTELPAEDAEPPLAARQALGRLMATELAELFTASREAVAALELRLESSPAGERLAIQRDIRAQKARFELGRLGLQARYARLAGNEDLAVELEGHAHELRDRQATDAPRVEDQ